MKKRNLKDIHSFKSAKDVTPSNPAVMLVNTKALQEKLLEDGHLSHPSMVPEDPEQFWDCFFYDTDFERYINVWHEDMAFDAYGKNGRIQTFNRGVFEPCVDGGDEETFIYTTLKPFDVDGLEDALADLGYHAIDWEVEVSEYDSESLAVYIVTEVKEATCIEKQIFVYGQTLTVYETKITVDWTPEL